MRDVGEAVGCGDHAFDVHFAPGFGVRLCADSKDEQQIWIGGLRARALLSQPGAANVISPTTANLSPLAGGFGAAPASAHVGQARYVEVRGLASFARLHKQEFVNRQDSCFGVHFHKPCWGSASPLHDAGVDLDAEVLVAVDGEACLSHTHASRLVGNKGGKGTSMWDDSGDDVMILLVAAPLVLGIS